MSMKYLGESFDIHAGGEDLIFPHHENEIAQSEAMTGKTFAQLSGCTRASCWSKARRCPRALGNFYTLRDLVLMGHKPSSIRFLLMSVPYRKQLNFTFDGLTQAANSVERLRNFKLRLETGSFPTGAIEKSPQMAAKASDEMRAALDDDLNTAQALGAIFDLVRDVNAAADRARSRKGDMPALLQVLAQFDEIFAVLEDDDAAKVRAHRRVGQRRGRRTRSARRPRRWRERPRSPTPTWKRWWPNIRRRARRRTSHARRHAQSTGRERHHPGEHQGRRALEEEVREKKNKSGSVKTTTRLAEVGRKNRRQGS